MNTIYIEDFLTASQRRTGYLVTVPRATLGIKNALHIHTRRDRGHVLEVFYGTIHIEVLVYGCALKNRELPKHENRNFLL